MSQNRKNSNYRVQTFKSSCSKCAFSYVREQWMGWIDIECYHPTCPNDDICEDGICNNFKPNR